MAYTEYHRVRFERDGKLYLRSDPTDGRKSIYTTSWKEWVENHRSLWSDSDKPIDAIIAFAEQLDLRSMMLLEIADWLSDDYGQNGEDPGRHYDWFWVIVRDGDGWHISGSDNGTLSSFSPDCDSYITINVARLFRRIWARQ